MAMSQLPRALSLRLSSLNRGRSLCERQACLAINSSTATAAAAAGSTSSLRHKSHSSSPDGLPFFRRFTTSTGSVPRGALFQPDGNVWGLRLGTTGSSCSLFSTQAATKNDVLQGRHARMTLQLQAREVEVPLVWLRDHCRCSNCYNTATGQKMVENYTLPEDLAATDTKLEGDKLHITWQDGHHSEYSLKWLNDNYQTPGRRWDRVLWDGAHWEDHPLPTTDYKEHMNTEEGLKNTLRNIIKYGFCLVQGGPETDKMTEEVSSRVGLIMHTIYGIVESIDSAVMNHDDTAYTNAALGPHTDTTYFAIPCGLQVFHLLYHDGEGGKTLLVDGYSQAEKVRKANPAHFRTLASVQIPHEYIEPKRNVMLYTDTVLTTERRTDDLRRIRYNPYDRAVLSNLGPDDVSAFYDGYTALANNINSKGSKLWTQLKPGTVLLVDNWRVMHGRSSFTGRRIMNGCFVSRDDWTSRARLLGVL